MAVHGSDPGRLGKAPLAGGALRIGDSVDEGGLEPSDPTFTPVGRPVNREASDRSHRRQPDCATWWLTCPPC